MPGGDKFNEKKINGVTYSHISLHFATVRFSDKINDRWLLEFHTKKRSIFFSFEFHTDNGVAMNIRKMF